MINVDRFYTGRYNGIMDLQLSKHSIYFFHSGLEERSSPADDREWEESTGAMFVDVALSNAAKDMGKLSSGEVFSLRSQEQIESLLLKNGLCDIYLDSSGMSVCVLAPLLKYSLELSNRTGVKVYVVYVEPIKYNVSKFKEGSRFYDLAEGFKGISPLPSLESIIPSYGKSALIPMLGFEGGRFAHVLSQLSSEDDLIIPIVGVSGYRPEYPFITYSGNRRALEDTESWAKIHFAMAGSVVDAFLELLRIRDKHQKNIRHWKIAPIGTKPHAIAALLFAILLPREVEIVYDNPTREKPRTKGVGRVSVTCVSDLIGDNHVS